MPWWLAGVTLVIMLALMALTVYGSPVTMGLTLIACALSLPAYGLLYLVQKHEYQPKAVGMSLPDRSFELPSVKTAVLRSISHIALL